MTEIIYFDQYNNKNHSSLGELINRLFEHRSRILIIRIDLGYKNEYRNSITLEVAQEHREHLLDNKRRNHSLFDHLLGYAWSFEHGSCNYDGESGTGYHHHLLLFYDGAHRREDIGLGMAIQDYWRRVITNGMGHCYISNFDKDRLAAQGCLGIGMIHRNDFDLRNNLLEHVAGYLTMESSMPPFIQSDRTATGGFRVFGRSQLWAPVDNNQPRRGRPPIRTI